MTILKTLHILNKPPGHSRYSLCLSSVAPGDTLLLIENGVLALAHQTEPDHGQTLALAPDIDARGLAQQAEKIRTISFDEMVELAASARKVISW